MEKNLLGLYVYLISMDIFVMILYFLKLKFQAITMFLVLNGALASAIILDVFDSFSLSIIGILYLHHLIVGGINEKYSGSCNNYAIGIFNVISYAVVFISILVKLNIH